MLQVDQVVRVNLHRVARQHVDFHFQVVRVAELHERRAGRHDGGTFLQHAQHAAVDRRINREVPAAVAVGRLVVCLRCRRCRRRIRRCRWQAACSQSSDRWPVRPCEASNESARPWPVRSSKRAISSAIRAERTSSLRWRYSYSASPIRLAEWPCCAPPGEHASALLSANA